jgi:acyl transferase domain-containing protein
MCYTYDHRASGYGRGEGVGTVILKSLNDAIRDGDAIRGVIRSTGVNSDGRTAGLMLPNGAAQEALIRSTYAAAGLDPAETRYVESHGTGTKAGDPIESGAIARVFGAASARVGAPSVRVGSIKTNIGHLENASGIAGLIKTILSVEKGFILPNSNFEKAGDRVSLEESNLMVSSILAKYSQLYYNFSHSN